MYTGPRRIPVLSIIVLGIVDIQTFPTYRSNANRIVCRFSNFTGLYSDSTHQGSNFPQRPIIKMLSNPLQRFSPYQNLPPSGLMSHSHVSQSPVHHNRSMDSLSQSSQYNVHQLHQSMGVGNHQLGRPGSQSKQRQNPYQANGRTNGSAGQVRRRISRACDQCNQLRTKCDGQHPCAHCVGKGSLLKCGI